MGNKPSSELWNPYPTSTYKPEDLRTRLDDIQRKSQSINRNKKFRIVMCAVGREGKSSSINNLLSALEGEYTQAANVGGHMQHVTSKYIEYKMLIGKENDTCYVLCDTPGLRDALPEDEQEVQTEAIKAALIGKFMSKDDVLYLKMKMQDLEEMEIKQDIAAAVIFVVDVRKVLNGVIDSSKAFQAMKSIKTFCQQTNIAIACLLTYCDEADNDVKKDMTKIYSSQRIEEARQMLEQKFEGFPGNRIFPIVNYTEKLDVNNGMMVQSLFALKHIMSDILSNLRKVVK